MVSTANNGIAFGLGVELLAEMAHVLADHFAQELDRGFDFEWPELDTLQESLTLQSAQHAEEMLVHVFGADRRHEQRRT